MDLSSNTTHCVGNRLFFPAQSQIPVPLMNPAPSNPALLSRLLLAKPAVVEAARAGVGSPVIGIGMELDLIAAVVIGGASLMGGRGTALNTDRHRGLRSRNH